MPVCKRLVCRRTPSFGYVVAPHMTTITRLRHALAALGWSQRDLARHLGYDDRTVRRWLSGAYEPAEGVLEWLERGVTWMEGRPRR